MVEKTKEGFSGSKDCETFVLSEKPVVQKIDGEDVQVMFLYGVNKETGEITSTAMIRSDEHMIYVHTLMGQDSSDSLKFFSGMTQLLDYISAVTKAKELLTTK